MKWKRSCGSAGGQRGNGSMLGEATLDVLGTFLDEAIRLLTLIVAPHFAVILTEDCARIGGDVGCYSFIAVDSHHILLAGLPAHSLALRPAHSRCHQFVTR